MKITFEVDENFVEYFKDFGWSKKEIKKHCRNFIEKEVLIRVDENDDFDFIVQFEDYLAYTEFKD